MLCIMALMHTFSMQLGSSSGQGLDFINGYTFLERFYSVSQIFLFFSYCCLILVLQVYDTTNSRVGFATTSQTDSTSN